MPLDPLESNPKYHFLLVEDHPADVILTRRALGQLESPIDVHVAIDGVEAMQFLKKEGRYTQVVRPHIVLLDLHLPRKDGRTVLREMKADLNLRTIPVIILTTSSAPADIKHAYELHANGYLSKPNDFEGFRKLMESVEQFWLRTAHL